MGLHEAPAKNIVMANGAVGRATLAGTVRLECFLGEKSNFVVLLDVTFAPFLRRNFISVRKLGEQGYSITFQDSAFRIVRADSVIGSGFLRNADGLYFFHARAVTRPKGEINQVKQVGADQWHRRFGHVSFRSLQDVWLLRV